MARFAALASQRVPIEPFHNHGLLRHSRTTGHGQARAQAASSQSVIRRHRPSLQLIPIPLLASSPPANSHRPQRTLVKAIGDSTEEKDGRLTGSNAGRSTGSDDEDGEAGSSTAEAPEEWCQLPSAMTAEDAEHSMAPVRSDVTVGPPHQRGVGSWWAGLKGRIARRRADGSRRAVARNEGRQTVAEGLETAETDFFQFSQQLGRYVFLLTLPGVALEASYELTGVASHHHRWELVWFCGMAGLLLGTMVGVGEVMAAHQQKQQQQQQQLLRWRGSSGVSSSGARALDPSASNIIEGRDFSGGVQADASAGEGVLHAGVCEGPYSSEASLRAGYSVVVTGSTRGLGKALAREFLLAGDDVVVTARSDSSVSSALFALQQEVWLLSGREVEVVVVGREEQEERQEEGSGVSAAKRRPRQQRVIGVACDVQSASDVRRLATVAAREMGRVDVWINNAGLNTTAKPFVEFEDHEVEQVVSTNLLGSLLCTRAALRLMQQQPPINDRASNQPMSGHIFNMEGAGSAGNGTPRYAAYGATKCAIRQMGRSVGEEERRGGEEGRRVGVHSASPGMVLTELLLSGSTLSNRQAFNILGELPETVARVLVPQIRAVRGSGASVQFLTLLRIAQAVLMAWRRKGRWFNKEGHAVYAPEDERIRVWAQNKDRPHLLAAMQTVPTRAWLSMVSSSAIGLYLIVTSLSI